jgi:hypothetical protein
MDLGGSVQTSIFAYLLMAVRAIRGAHRLVHIGEAMPDPAWTATGRLAHHASHMPRHTGR